MNKHIMKKLGLVLSITFFSMPIGAEVSRTFQVADDVRIIISKGDITQYHCEAIVNAANEQLMGGGGVCGAIFNAAGWSDMQSACNAYTVNGYGVRCPVGECRITDSFNLAPQGIKHVIHAVGPDCRVVKDQKQQDSLLQHAYSNSLALADQNNITSIAFPFISSAIYAFPKRRACDMALRAVCDYLNVHTTGITSIHFVLFFQQDFDLFCDVIRKQHKNFIVAS